VTRTQRDWDELAARASDDPVRRGTWQVLLGVALVALVVFVLLATFVKSLAVQVLVVAGVAVYALVALMARRWRWRQIQTPTTSSITSRWFER
jgi:hypothetical protein